MASVIRFFDIPSNLGEKQAWSPSTWKIRFALNYKKLPYETTWVEYPDIENTCKELGADPTSVRNGKSRYTFPVIHDPSTGKTISDSLAIAKYLDAQYPDTPRLFPSGTMPLQLALLHALAQTVERLVVFSIPASLYILNEVSRPFVREAREVMFGKKLEDVPPAGAEREPAWAKIREGFGTIDGWIQEGGGPFVMGDTISYVDFALGAIILYLKRVFGEESVEWKDISQWNEGRWVKRLEDLKTLQDEDK
ncbi:hypothetical protein HGRIS_006251 [Hohenbuehelia grisea]|uniref:GST N-terminal domain-containing protein n=1 Tax=Hohenbuehelia grisea TaxID=104357 RepID=A0ABR3JZS4_9AGAR